MHYVISLPALYHLFLRVDTSLQSGDSTGTGCSYGYPTEVYPAEPVWLVHLDGATPHSWIVKLLEEKVKNMTWTMGDMSDPGTMRVGEDVTGFYIGGATPHSWTIKQVQMQTSPLRLPIWSYGNNKGGTGGTLEAVYATQAAEYYGVPKDSKIVVDMETSTDYEYVTAFSQTASRLGYSTGVYGSRDTAEMIPVQGGGRWVADWTGTPHMSGLPGEFACQWQKAGGPGNEKNPWDVSLVGDISGFWNPDAVDAIHGILVNLPVGSTRMVRSVNGGKSWS